MKKDGISIFLELLKSFFSLPIILILVIFLVYLFGILYCLSSIEIVHSGNYKVIFIWVVFSAFPTCLGVDEMTRDKSYFKTFFWNQFKTSAFVGFIIEFYKFNFVIEFFLVPIFFILAFPGTNSNPIPPLVKTFYKNVRRGIDILIVSYVVIQIFLNTNSIVNNDASNELFLPMILSIALIPFLFILSRVAKYETIFISLTHAIPEPSLMRRSKLYTMLFFRFNVEALQRWRHHIALNPIKSNEELKASIFYILNIEKKEKTPSKVSFNKGWSPQKAKNFLMWEGIETHHYTNLAGTWGTHSNIYFQPDDDRTLKNAVQYHLTGEADIVKELLLTLNVQIYPKIAGAHELFLRFANALYKEALDADLPSFIKDRILNGMEFCKIVDEIEISITRDDWPGGKMYSLRFQIKNISP